MTPPIVYIDISAIREGRLAEVKTAMEGLVAFVEENVPRLISYGFFLDESEKQMTVVAVHPDSASLEFHLDVGGAQFARFAELIELSRIDVYGPVSDSALERLNRKAKMLGRGIVATHGLYAGFYRGEG